MFQLIAIVQVEKQERIYCQAENCRHTVYKQIHVVFDGFTFKLYGISCFEKLFGELLAAAHKPMYVSGSGGRRLTAEEQELLINNTEKLIEHFKRQFEEQEQARKEAKLHDEQEALRIQANKIHQTMSVISQRQPRHQYRSPDVLVAHPNDFFEKERWNTAWQMAVKQLQDDNPGQDITAPWFSSSLRIEATRIYNTLK